MEGRQVIIPQVSGKMIVTVAKCDNGFIVTLVEPPKDQKQPKKPIRDLDHEIDNLIEGITALSRHMKKGVEGPDQESWRGDGDHDGSDRQKLREAFKRLHPEFFEVPSEPRIEQKVFGTKKELFSYLTANL